ncbi:hypothetical protein [Mesorhizobium sp. INR15]|uniref:hypothetical protein n=1 Tax=Mesorhizobium sp. INR15 TaxID=2654248 RepID=UPI0018965D64|nr:hypothetical protein [Mesorhizobium sp. INR15]QPC90305.1 hypothetical protein GA829_06710 [Mesorhizobium sp. INR15]
MESGDEQKQAFGKGHDQFYASIGMLVVAWAEAESAIDALIDVAYDHYNGHAIDAERPRTALARKMSFCRKFIRCVSETEKIAQSYLVHFDHLGTDADYRHDVVHSAYLEILEEQGRASITRLIKASSQKPMRKTVEIDSQTIVKIAIMTQRRAVLVFTLANDLLEIALARGPIADARTPMLTRRFPPIRKAYERLRALLCHHR